MTLPCAPRPIAILLVEDNPGDARLVREALKSAGIDSLLTVARDGEEAGLMTIQASTSSSRTGSGAASTATWATAG